MAPELLDGFLGAARGDQRINEEFRCWPPGWVSLLKVV